MASAVDLASGLFASAQSISNAMRSAAEAKISAAAGSITVSNPTQTVNENFINLTEADLKTRDTTPYVSTTALDAAKAAYEAQLLQRQSATPDLSPATGYAISNDDPVGNYNDNYAAVAASIAANLTSFYTTHFPFNLNGTDLTLAQNWTIRVLTDGGAMDPAIENQYWSRDRDRVGREASVKVLETTTLWAARGFPLPPGAATGAVANIQRTALEQLAASSREIAIKKFEIEVMLQQKAVELAIQLRGTAVNACFEYIKTAVLAPYEFPTRYAAMIAQSKQAANAALDSYFNSTQRAKENLRSLLIEMGKDGISTRTAFKDKAVEIREKATAEWLLAEQTQPNAIFAQDKAAKEFEFGVKSKQADLAMSAAQLSATMAASALNAVHASATVSGSDTTSTQYYG